MKFYIEKVTVLLIMFLLVMRLAFVIATYEDGKRIYDQKLSSSVYETNLRPLDSQNKTMRVYVTFSVVSIVDIDDVDGRFTCNGFIALRWFDERVKWVPSEYGDLHAINPAPKQIWRPRVILVNTLGDRDLFEDDHAPVGISATGEVSWYPGGLFPTSCSLDMTNYPFDTQLCHVQFFSMGFSTDELYFYPDQEISDQTYYISNGEWDLLRTAVIGGHDDRGPANSSFFRISFEMKRRPAYLIINIVLPVVLLSFLNILVFLIPVESGEKISFGITVLLALAVFLSIVSSSLPSSSEPMPKLVIYLFILLTISVLTVVDSIVIVFIHHKEEREEKFQRAKSNFKSVFQSFNKRKSPVTNKISDLVGPLAKIEKNESLKMDSESIDVKNSIPEEVKVESTTPSANKYKLIGKYIDMVSFIVFTVVWVAVTMGFLISMSA